jgi:hypothetical protein
MSPKIAAAVFVKCQFDEAACKIGLKRLNEYCEE